MLISIIGRRGLAASAVVGTLGAGTLAMADTNWNALSTADWGGAPAQEVGPIAEAGGGAGGANDWSDAIQKAFVELGMAEPRAECFGEVLAEKLSPEEQQAAAALIGDAATADEVKIGVISGGPEMVGGFSAADATCPESMGG